MSRMFAAFALLAAALAALADDPPPNPGKGDTGVDVAKTAEQIIQDAKDAGKRLGNKDSGVTTQQIQQNVLKNIDELLRKAKQPPPPDGGSGGTSSSDKGMGGSTQKQQSSGGDSSSSAQRKERREKRNQMTKGSTKDGQSDGQPGPMSSGSATHSTSGINQSKTPNKIESKTSGLPPRIPDAYKNVWGQLPEKVRQEMDLYFREDFMPRYSDLLRQYYSSLAERDGKNKR